MLNRTFEDKVEISSIDRIKISKICFDGEKWYTIHFKLYAEDNTYTHYFLHYNWDNHSLSLYKHLSRAHQHHRFCNSVNGDFAQSAYSCITLALKKTIYPSKTEWKPSVPLSHIDTNRFVFDLCHTGLFTSPLVSHSVSDFSDRVANMIESLTVISQQMAVLTASMQTLEKARQALLSEIVELEHLTTLSDEITR